VIHATLRLGILFWASIVLAAAAPAAAEEEAAAEPVAEAAAEPEGPFSRLSGSAQVDFTNAYYFRGILQERNGLVAQPWGELYYSLYASETGFIRDFSIGGGVWASFHTEETLAEHGPHSLYEVDWYPVLSVEFPNGVSLTTIYYFYTSPNGAFQRVDELNLKLAWDDSETFGRFALQPWINLAIETHRTSFGDDEGAGLQLGIAPTLYEFAHDSYPVTFTVPIEAGFAIDDYYEREDGSENHFGYLSFGLSASVPLAFMPESAGAWTFTLTGKGLYFSNTLAEVNLGRSLYPVFTASLGVEF
jgi:hypothetical protein